MLAFEPKEPGLMQRPPLNPQKPLLTRELMAKIGIVGFLLLVGAFVLFEWELKQGNSLAAARTCAVNVFVFGELFYLFNCRSLRYSMFRLGLLSNRWLLVGVGIMIMLQLLFTYLPAMHTAFVSQSIGLREWGGIFSASFTIYVVIEIEKWLRRRVSA
jgi:Ca2+-transporting ATPase